MPISSERLRLSAVDKPERLAMNQAEFDAEFGSRLPLESTSTKFRRRLKQSFFQPCSSCSALSSSFFSFFPIIFWLPKYQWKDDLLADVVGGLTTGIMHVPQGIAYAVLAGVSPVYGLYASCFPAFFYMIFGTSKHTSLGSFAVVALMAGIAAENISTTTGSTAIHAATAVAFSIGILQILCGLLRLKFILAYFSAPLVSGFTTGAAVHVLMAQLDDIMGVELPKSHGPGYVFIRFFDLIRATPQTNVITLLISVLSMIFLFTGKQFLTPFLNKKFHLKLPIPFELILVVLTAFLSSFFRWNEKFDVMIVGEVPAGIPTAQLPPFYLIKAAIFPSLSIAIVTIAIHISMAKMLANKFNYKIDVNQELYALGLSSCLGSFFPIYAVSTALGRTMVSVRSGSRTQLSAFFSCLLLLAVILWLGPLLTTLPKCILSSIITISLIPMFEKITEPKSLWPISRYDALTWIVAFLATTCTDVMEGLSIALLFAILTVVMRTQWPHWQYFVPDEEKEDAADVAMLRFEGPLQFTNGERFKAAVEQILSEWETPRRPKSLNSGKFFIFDCHAMVYLDSVGISIFREIMKILVEKKIIIYMAGATEEVRRVLISSNTLPLDQFFPSVRDAISMANRNIAACKILFTGKKEMSGTPSPLWNPPRRIGDSDVTEEATK